MLFNSHIFILLFLPLLLAGWYFLNWKKKFQLAQGYLIGMSLWFYAYANLQYLWLLLFSCLIGWLLSCLPEKISSEKGKKVLTGVGCVFHLGLLGYFKYSNFFLENLNTVFHTDFPMLQILLPVGISFYTFQQLAYLIDRCRGDAPRDSFFDYLTFMVYFPQLLQGPILLRSEFMEQLKEPERRRFHAERFSEGIQFFVFGLAKKVLLADTLAKAVNYGYSNVSMLDSISALLLAVGYLTELYFDFSGYCDMAVGLGKMIGLEVAENFDAPFHSASVKEFWRRWHMTLGGWFRDYLYIPLGGNRVSVLRWCFNMFVVWLLSGLWHGAGWNFALWGLYFGVFLSAEKLIEKKWKERSFKIADISANNDSNGGNRKNMFLICARNSIEHGYVLLVVLFSFVIFRVESVREIKEQLLGLAGSYGNAMTPMAAYEIKSYLILLLIACAGATPFPAMCVQRLKNTNMWKKSGWLLQSCYILTGLVLATAFLLGSSVHPFLYFRF